ncbi:hypothetical protein GCM10027445_62630 [Amycolatopsis endophytica]
MAGALAANGKHGAGSGKHGARKSKHADGTGVFAAPVRVLAAPVSVFAGAGGVLAGAERGSRVRRKVSAGRAERLEGGGVANSSRPANAPAASGPGGEGECQRGRRGRSPAGGDRLRSYPATGWGVRGIPAERDVSQLVRCPPVITRLLVTPFE